MDNVGEAQITPPVQGQVAADVVSPQGKAELFQRMATGTIEKPGLDKIFGAVASSQNGQFTSRIKSPQTVVQKIASKRMAGRNYNLEDINDIWGGRITVDSKKDISKVVKKIEDLESAGLFKIIKNEEVTNDTYHAKHLDFQTTNGLKGEIQIMLPQEHVESLANHTLRANFGESPDNPALQQLRDKQAQVAKSLPNDKAKAVTQALQAISKQQGSQISPVQSASILAQSQQS